MYEATFRVTGPGTYAELTADADVTVELWCNEHCDLLHVSGGDPDAALDAVRDHVGVQELLAEGDERVVITGECLKAHEEPHVEPHLERHDCLLLPPLVYADGARRCRVLALDPAKLTAFYRDLLAEFDVTVESKREVDAVAQDAPLLALADAMPTLSARQRETLHAAYDRGYYEIPRSTTTAAIGDTVGVDRRTAEEHLRRAENKLMAALFDRGIL